MTREELDALIKAQSAFRVRDPHLSVHVPEALDLLELLITQSQATHEPMDWKILGVFGNLEHASHHLIEINIESGKNIQAGEAEDHLLNTTCRLLMALQLREEAKNVK